jgi:biopolymer transport protein ExbD
MSADTGNFSDENNPISAINVTPFVDVVLVLLVIFMVTAPALMKDSIGIHLPKASSADQKSTQTLGIAVTKQGQILVNGQLADPAAVAAAVQAALRTNPDTQALISADTDARHGDVVRAIDMVKSAGLTHFGLQIEKPQE